MLEILNEVNVMMTRNPFSSMSSRPDPCLLRVLPNSEKRTDVFGQPYFASHAENESSNGMGMRN